MNISKFIEELEKLKSEHGDLEVHSQFISGRAMHCGPELARIKILKGREHKRSFACEYDLEDRQGDIVCRI